MTQAGSMILPTYDPKLDFYAVLGIDPSATPAETKAAFYRAVRKVHPDLNQAGKRSTRETQRINEAKILLNPRTRAGYDRARAKHRASARRRRARPVRRAPKVQARNEPSPPLGNLDQAWIQIASAFLRGLHQR